MSDECGKILDDGGVWKGTEPVTYQNEEVQTSVNNNSASRKDSFLASSQYGLQPGHHQEYIVRTNDGKRLDDGGVWKGQEESMLQLPGKSSVDQTW